jgi:hypothetical protein
MSKLRILLRQLTGGASVLDAQGVLLIKVCHVVPSALWWFADANHGLTSVAKACRAFGTKDREKNNLSIMRFKKSVFGSESQTTMSLSSPSC